MKKFRHLLPIAAVTTLLGCSVSLAAPINIPGATTIESHHSAQQTEAHLQALLKTNHFVVKDVFNHHEWAASKGKKVPAAESIFFAKPAYNFALLQHQPMAVLVLPMQIDVFEGKDSKTYITYWNVEDQRQLLKINDAKLIKQAQAISGLVDKIANQAAN